MVGAARVERGPTGRTGIVAGQVVGNTNGIVTVAAIDGRLTESGGGPNDGNMPGRFIVALDAGVKFIATLEFDGNDVALRMVVRTLSPRIYAGAMNGDRGSG